MKLRNINVINGICVTICDDGNIIENIATLDTDTGELWTSPIDTDELGCLIDEQYFESDDGEFHEEICKKCRNFIISNEHCKEDCV